MSWLAGPYLVAAGLLVLAGGSKIAAPSSASRALASLHWPASRHLVRLLGVAEVGLGLAALVAGGRVPASLVALAYVSFSGFVALALARGGVLGSCGCFGTPDTPPTRTHLGLTLVLAAAALAVAVRPFGPPLVVVQDSPGTGIPLAGLTAVSIWLGYLVFAVLPRSGGLAVARADSARRA